MSSNIINYEKYLNMSEKQLANARSKEVKLNAELQKKLENSTNLINFLEAKINEIWKKQKKENYIFIPLEQSQSYKNYSERFATMSESEKAELKAKVESDEKRNYGDEL